MSKFKVLFVIISILHLLGLTLNFEIIAISTKPLILISLLLYYINSSENKSGIYIGAVMFSLLGDVLLISDSEINFMLGLASFLIAHLLFIFIVLKNITESSLRYKVSSVLPFLLIGSTLLYFLKDSLGEMLVPVIIYATVISLFGAVSLLNYLNNRSRRSVQLLLGALFFITSDSVLAINKFYDAKTTYPLLVMITYILAQYFICSYVLNEKIEKIGINKRN